MTITELATATLLLLATLLVLLTAVALHRAPDSLSRVNVMGVTVGVALPLLLLAHLVHDWGARGLHLADLLRVILTCAGLWVVASAASFVMGRSVHGATVTDPDSEPGLEEDETHRDH